MCNAVALIGKTKNEEKRNRIKADCSRLARCSFKARVTQ
jgi:hypothetical protein